MKIRRALQTDAKAIAEIKTRKLNVNLLRQFNDEIIELIKTKEYVEQIKKRFE